MYCVTDEYLKETKPGITEKLALKFLPDIYCTESLDKMQKHFSISPPRKAVFSNRYAIVVLLGGDFNLQGFKGDNVWGYIRDDESAMMSGEWTGDVAPLVESIKNQTIIPRVFSRLNAITLTYAQNLHSNNHRIFVSDLGIDKIIKDISQISPRVSATKEALNVAGKGIAISLEIILKSLIR